MIEPQKQESKAVEFATALYVAIEEYAKKHGSGPASATLTLTDGEQFKVKSIRPMYGEYVALEMLTDNVIVLRPVQIARVQLSAQMAEKGAIGFQIMKE